MKETKCTLNSIQFTFRLAHFVCILYVCMFVRKKTIYFRRRALCFGTLLHVCCSVLQCVAVCCSVLQCVEVCCSVL